MQKNALKESVESVMDIVRTGSEVDGITIDRILLAGISQGRAMAILELLCERSGATRTNTAFLTRVLLEHCEDDEVVPIGSGKDLEEGLTVLGRYVEIKYYDDIRHWVNKPTGIDDMMALIEQRL
ncbi:hypothetical protein CC78DRAFT_549321 [Lojkania enalia]|uniref:Uncharacterized protein n=1 Tax=Lojkania enalia TaxID=147567 RepID=A0A9P4N0Y9_9PLEO|nr:hypothetical protein CC78DRAFT_549321 [Didymosphaeria enalia]